MSEQPRKLNFCVRWALKLTSDLIYVLLLLGDTKGCAALSNAMVDFKKSLSQREDKEDGV